MPITRELALKIIKYLLDNPSFYFPFKVMCKEYVNYMDNDDGFVEIVPQDDYENLVKNLQYYTFELWENLQDVRKNTTELLAKWFIDKIIKHNFEKEIKKLAQDYWKLYKQDLTESASIEEYWENEFFWWKKEAFEDILDLFEKYKF